MNTMPERAASRNSIRREERVEALLFLAIAHLQAADE